MKKIFCKFEIMKKLSKSSRNITWEVNHRIISDSYLKLIKKLGRKPTYEEVVQDTGISRATLQKHIAELKFEPQEHPLRILTDEVILSIYKSAIKGSSASQKLWFMLMEGWNEHQVIEHTGNVNVEQVREKIIRKLAEIQNN